MVLLFHQVLPVGASDGEPRAVQLRFVNETGSLVERQIVSSDDDVFRQSQHELFEMVNLKPNVNCARMEEQDLVHLVKLIQNYHVCELLAGLKYKQQLLHKGSIGKIPPSVATGLVVVLKVWESESLAVAIQEIFE